MTGLAHALTDTAVIAKRSLLRIPRAPDLSVLRGADAAFNAGVARRLLDGEAGPVRDAVVINAAAALAARAGFGPGHGTDQPGALREAIKRAEQSIDSGAARSTLDTWVARAKSLAG